VSKANTLHMPLGMWLLVEIDCSPTPPSFLKGGSGSGFYGKGWIRSGWGVDTPPTLRRVRGRLQGRGGGYS